MKWDNKYYLAYTINYEHSEGHTLARILDLDDSDIRCSIEHIKGFKSKRNMIDWANEHAKAVNIITMLKPVD